MWNAGDKLLWACRGGAPDARSIHSDARPDGASSFRMTRYFWLCRPYGASQISMGFTPGFRPGLYYSAAFGGWVGSESLR
jgi:hypothetical protein